MTVLSFFRISAAFSARWEASFSAREASLTARICTARKAAFFAPSTATVAVDGGTNAALLAAQILAVEDGALSAKLEEKRAADARKVLDKDAGILERL